ncbi:MAG: hypothetical protein PVF83_11980 [Anaerolineales bacterium]|jgi:hypothetical protein
MKNTSRLLLTLALLLTILIIIGCSPDMPQGSEHDAGEVALCKLSEDILGWRLITDGTITFVDLSPSDGVYFEFQDAGCDGGAFIHNEFWNGFSEDQQSQIASGNTVQIEGILLKDGTRLIVSVQKLLNTP